ncbi:MAG: mechanosensitive ion channel family protein [Spirochaetales bacterium]|nr:mechanosensitive ion channel family protein [Spirochaetales bacterium]
MSFEAAALAWLQAQSLPDSLARPLSYFASVLLLLILGLVLGFLVRGIIGVLLRRWAQKTETLWDDFLFDPKFFHRLSLLAPAVALYFFLRTLFPESWIWFPFMNKLSLLAIIASSSSFLNQLVANFERGFRAIHPESKLPLRSYTQISKIIVLIVAAVMAVSVLIEQQPWGVLSGIGALTAIFALVFKDVLLGFVASVQIHSSQVFKLGDWIEVQGQGVEGEVVDISLNTVLIKSGDNSTFSVPTYSLVSGTVKNWRTVAENSARRLKISLPFDARSVVAADEVLEKSLKEKDLWVLPQGSPPEPWGETNLEVFRHFCQQKLESLPEVRKENPIVVRILDPVGKGVVIEMFFYTTVTGYPEWANLQSRLLSAFLGASREFALTIFQEGLPR